MRIKLRCAGVDRNSGLASTEQSWTPESNSTRPAGASGLRTRIVKQNSKGHP